MNCLIQSQADIIELLCPRLAPAGDKSRRKCEDGITPCGFINPFVSPDAKMQCLAHSTGRISHAQRLESKAEGSPPRLLCRLSAFCRERLSGPSHALRPDGSSGRTRGPACSRGKLLLGRRAMSQKQPDAGAERPPQLPPGATLPTACRDPGRLTRAQWRHRKQSPGLQTSLLETALYRTCSFWVTHTLLEHTLSARGA